MQDKIALVLHGLILLQFIPAPGNDNGISTDCGRLLFVERSQGNNAAFVCPQREIAQIDFIFAVHHGGEDDLAFSQLRQA